MMKDVDVYGGEPVEDVPEWASAGSVGEGEIAFGMFLLDGIRAHSGTPADLDPLIEPGDLLIS